MKSLWPTNLNQPTKNPIRTRLTELANELPGASGNRLLAEVDQRHLEGIFIFSLLISPAGPNGGSYELLRVRAPNGSFPAVIEAYHLGATQKGGKNKKNDGIENTEEAGRLQKVDDQDSFESALTKVLQHDRTAEILRLLADEVGEPAAS